MLTLQVSSLVSTYISSKGSQFLTVFYWLHEVFPIYYLLKKWRSQGKGLFAPELTIVGGAVSLIQELPI